jgi:hypothetical protein
VANESDNTRDTGQNALTVSLAMLAGLGMTVMIVAAASGVIDGASADGAAVGLLFTAGVALLVVGLVAWAAVVRPWENFDDINQPVDSDHHHVVEYSDEEPGEVHVEEPVPPQTTAQ